jgi:asparagine synthase (glutamine-hydrolysing)
MNQLFGYKNIRSHPSTHLSGIRPNFQPSFEYIEKGTTLFLGGDISKRKNNQPFENHKILVTILGNIYFKQDFLEKYPDYQKYTDEESSAIIAHLFLNHGADTLYDFTGDYIIIINDKSENKLILVRDKIGGRKLYYSLLDDYIIFSSNIKNILSIPGVSRDVDYFALESFFKFGYVIAPNTIFKSIKELEPGHIIEIRQGGYEMITYWNLYAHSEISENKNEIRNILYDKIEENISVRLRNKDKIGIYLSGGIDSNTLLAFLSKYRNPSDIITMSIGYGEQYKDYHELNQARFSASYYGSNHHELINGPEHIDKYLCKMVWGFEQPFGNPALISWVALSELAKDFVDVVFIGAGADEVLGGYRRYNALRFLEIYNKLPYHSLASKTLSKILGNFSIGANHYNVLYRLKKLFDGTQDNLLKANEVFLFGYYSRLRKSLFLKNTWNNALYEEPTLDRYYRIGNSDDYFTQVFIADCYSDLVSEQLTRALIPLEQYDIDYRAPFSDPDFLLMCLAIPDRYKMNMFKTKRIYKEAVKAILPKEIITQKKRGMSHPVNLWLQGVLYEDLKRILSCNNGAIGDYFNMDFLLTAVDEHYLRKRDWGSLLWKIIVFTMWHRLFVEDKIPVGCELTLQDLYINW